MTSWVFDGRAGSRAKLSRGTAAARRTRKTVPHERGCGTAAARRQTKTVVHRPVLVGGQVMVMVMVVRYQIQIPRFARELGVPNL